MFAVPGGIMHHALDDAIVQAKAVCAPWRVIETKRGIEQ